MESNATAENGCEKKANVRERNWLRHILHRAAKSKGGNIQKMKLFDKTATKNLSEKNKKRVERGGHGQIEREGRCACVREMSGALITRTIAALLHCCCSEMQLLGGIQAYTSHTLTY